MAKSKHFGLFLCIFFAYLTMTTAAAIENASNKFATSLFKTLASDTSEKNLIYSPVSIQSCLAMAYLGAKGQTAEEMRKGLNLGQGDIQAVAKNYGDFLTKSFSTSKNDGPVLKLANRIYVNEGLKVNTDVKALLQNNFKSDIEQLSFANSPQAIDKINNYVEQATNGQIKNLMSHGSVNSDTGAILVNAIYFKGKWLYPFSKISTTTQDFAVSTKQTNQVEMMNSEEYVKYAELPELDATAIELPYANSDMSMLIVLPNQVDGLKETEHKLANLDLNREVIPKLVKMKVDIFLPKFKIEYDADLTSTLKTLGISRIFTNAADLSGFFDASAPPQKVSQVKHKAFLEVNEAGTEAAAATFIKMVPMSFNPSLKVFRANHPFVFAIRNNETIYYAGHVVNI